MKRRNKAARATNNALNKGPGGSKAFKDNTGDVEDRPFRLLDLPPELWSRIVRIHIQDSNQPTLLCFDSWAEHRQQLRQPSITKVCRALREETLPCYYSIVRNSRWVDESIAADRSSLLQWLQTTAPADRRHISGLQILSDYKDAPRRYSNELAPLGLGVRLATDEPDEQVYRWGFRDRWFKARCYSITQLGKADASSVKEASQASNEVKAIFDSIPIIKPPRPSVKDVGDAEGLRNNT